MERIFSSPSRNLKDVLSGLNPSKTTMLIRHCAIMRSKHNLSALLSNCSYLCPVDIELQYTLVTLRTKLDILGNSISNHSSKQLQSITNKVHFSLNSSRLLRSFFVNPSMKFCKYRLCENYPTPIFHPLLTHEYLILFNFMFSIVQEYF